MAKELEEAFDEYNQRYFGGTLPRVPVRWSRLCDKAHGGEYLYDVQRGEIRISPCLKPFGKYTRITLIHEMSHHKFRGHKGDVHGPHWQKDMRRLARLGAFDDLW